MGERYPDDATLQAMTEDPVTGVEYIPTGKSPYYLEFRRLVQRMLLAAQRANDLRVYRDGDLSVGVRPGRCVIGGQVVVFNGAEEVEVERGAATYLWLDALGDLQKSTEGMPADRSSFVPLAEVRSGAEAIKEILDRRGEAFLHVPGLAGLGVRADVEVINRVLEGLQETVDAEALNRLTGGPTVTADGEHRHLQVWQNADEEVYFYLYNDHAGENANVGLVLSLPNRLPDDLVLLPNLANGFLSQRYNGQTYNLVGTVHVWAGHGGTMTTSQSKLMGMVPISGVVRAVILSIGTNLQSSVPSDGIEARVRVKGVLLTSTHPKITSAAGAGFRSTAQGHGTMGVVRSDGVQNVSRGDVLAVDLVRTVSGTVSTEAADVVAMVVVCAAGPE